MKTIRNLSIALIFGVLLVTVCSATDYPKYPVLSLRYNGTHGSETDEDTDELLPASMRHSITFKMVEEFSKDFYLNFPVQYTRKDYFSLVDNYFYFRLSPYVSWDIEKEHNLKFYLTTKWMDYNDLDSYGLSKDYLQLAPSFAYSFKPFTGTKLMGTIKGVYMFYDNTAKRNQDYALRISAETRINQYSLTGYYRGALRLPLGTESQLAMDFLNTFGVSIEWDPNRVEKN